jgi:hypothetical protein
MMSTPQEQVQCVLWLAQLQSLMAVQHRFGVQYGSQPPIRKSIWSLDNKLTTAVKSPGRTRTSEENVNRIREAFHTDQFVLLVCSYKFHIQQCTMWYTRDAS